MASEYLTTDYARFCIRSMAEQVHGRYPNLSVEETINLLLDVSTLLLCEYSKYLVLDGYISREEAEQEIRAVFSTGK